MHQPNKSKLAVNEIYNVSSQAYRGKAKKGCAFSKETSVTSTKK